MGAKNSKVKGGQKEGVAGSDESADVADNRTATLPASFKQKEIEAGGKTETLPRNLNRSTSFTESCRNWAKKKGIVKDKNKEETTEENPEQEAMENGTAEVKPKIEKPVITKIATKKARAQFFEDMYNSSGISVSSTVTPEKPKRLCDMNLPSPRIGPNSPATDKAEGKVEHLTKQIEEKERLNKSLDSDVSSLNRSLEQEAREVAAPQAEMHEEVIGGKVETSTVEASMSHTSMSHTSMSHTSMSHSETRTQQTMVQTQETVTSSEETMMETKESIETNLVMTTEAVGGSGSCLPQESLEASIEEEVKEDLIEAAPKENVEESIVEEVQQDLIEAAVKEDTSDEEVEEEEVKGLLKVQELLSASSDQGALDETLPSNARLEPVAAEPLAAEPVTAEPLAAEPVAAEPLAAEPLAAEPLAAEPLATEPSQEDTDEEEQTKEQVEEVGEVNEINDTEDLTVEPSSLESVGTDDEEEGTKHVENGDEDESREDVINTGGDSDDEGGASTDEGYAEEKKAGGAEGLGKVLRREDVNTEEQSESVQED